MALPTLSALAAAPMPKKMLAPILKERMMPLCDRQPGAVREIIKRLWGEPHNKEANEIYDLLMPENRGKLEELIELEFTICNDESDTEGEARYT